MHGNGKRENGRGADDTVIIEWVDSSPIYSRTRLHKSELLS